MRVLAVTAYALIAPARTSGNAAAALVMIRSMCPASKSCMAFSVGAFDVKHFRLSPVDRILRMSLAGFTLLFGIGAFGPPMME
jgi:hypothetical protein